MKITKRNLEREAAVRLRFLERVVAFALSIVNEWGKELSQAARGCNFGGFYFCVDRNNVKIWYQPDPQDNKAHPVLDTCWWQDDDGWGIRQFEPDPDLRWQIEILKVIRCRVRIGSKLNHEHVELMRKKRNDERKRLISSSMLAR